MVLLIKNIADLLNDKLTLEERGILVTILLLKESDPKITLAKVKTKLKMQKVKATLIKLQDNGYIKWSGYKSAKKSLEDKAVSPQVVEVIDFMNKLYGRKFDASSPSTTKNLKERLKKHDVETIKRVVANRYAEWKDDAVMCKHLNPTTIFRPSKFDKYLEDVLRTKKGESFVSAQKIDLKQGDEITAEIAKTFSDNDVYTIKTYQCDTNGNKRGNGMEAKRYGRDIKKMLKVQENLAKRGLREHIYTYQNK